MTVAYYELTWRDASGKPHTVDLDDEVAVYIDNHPDSFPGFDRYGDGLDPLLWTDKNECMRALSMHFPGVVFMLYESDHSGEFMNYWCNGVSQRVAGEIEFPDFDPSLCGQGGLTHRRVFEAIEVRLQKESESREDYIIFHKMAASDMRYLLDLCGQLMEAQS